VAPLVVTQFTLTYLPKEAFAMGALALISAILPAVETVVKDLQKSVKGGKKPDPTDRAAPTGSTATSISEDRNFQDAVGKRRVGAAANAAADAIPEQALRDGLTSLDKSRGAAKQLSAQLKAISSALQPCYEAEDYTFYLYQVLLSKDRFADDDKTLLMTLWQSVTEQVDNVVSTTKNAFAGVEDIAVVGDFTEISQWSAGFERNRLDQWFAKPTDAKPQDIDIEVRVHDLLQLLSKATNIGGDVLDQIARGLVSEPQQDPGKAA
jgi:hypothetical protein